MSDLRCPGCETDIEEDDNWCRGADGVRWHGECYAEEHQCLDCGGVDECVCPAPFVDVYLPGDGPKVSTDA